MAYTTFSNTKNDVKKVTVTNSIDFDIAPFLKQKKPMSPIGRTWVLKNLQIANFMNDADKILWYFATEHSELREKLNVILFSIF
jgi:hypothetical protein